MMHNKINAHNKVKLICKELIFIAIFLKNALAKEKYNYEFRKS